jgi:hypothetical protein
MVCRDTFEDRTNCFPFLFLSCTCRISVKGVFLFVIAMAQQRCMNMIIVHILALVVFFLLEFMFLC